MSYAEDIEIRGADSGSLDAFGSWRVSQKVTLFDTAMVYDLAPLKWETVETASGTATHLPNESSCRLRVTTNGDAVLRQTRQYFRYQTGRSHMILMTGVLGASATGVTARMGYYDDNNGLYLEQTASGANIVRRTYTSGSVVNNSVAQASWNIDVMDGSGQSGVTLDFSKTLILVIDFQWLGVGRVRVGFEVDGVFYPAHQFLNTNVLSTVYMTTPHLPLRYEISAGASASTTDLIQICSNVSSEGGAYQEQAYSLSAGNGTTTISVTTRRPVMSIRPNDTFNSITNRTQIKPTQLDVYSEDEAALIELVYGGALTGASFADVDATYSAVEVDVAATAITGGIVIESFYIAAASTGILATLATVAHNLAAEYPLTLDESGAHPTSPSDILSVVVTSVPGGATDVAAQMTWHELR